MLLIFDWDGTLIDSKSKITLAMQLAASDIGWEALADHEIHNIIGLGLPEALLQLYPDSTPEDRQRLREAYAMRFLALDDEKPSEFFPGVMPTLLRLQEQGHSLAVATGKSRKGLDRIFRALGIESFFHATRCADETASKPDPQMLKELLSEFDVSAECAVMIGDTEYDLGMAQAIGMPRIAVSYGAHHIDRLRVYEPELCLNQFHELLTWEKLASPC